MIGVICILVFGWIARGYLLTGVWSWNVKRLEKVDIYNGMAPLVGPGTKPKNEFARKFISVLNAI